MMTMALMPPPGDQEFATKQDVDTAVGRVERRLERLEDKLDRAIGRLEDKLDRVIERLGSCLTKDDLTEHLKHYATKADVERMGRVLSFWVVGSIFALIAGMLAAMWKMTNTMMTLAG